MGIRVTKKTKAAFANLLKDWRARRGITQAEAAEVLGVPVRTLQNWEIARTAPHSSLRQILEGRLE
jgi:DNA-binding transcriptional regulator YiaG